MSFGPTLFFFGRRSPCRWISRPPHLGPIFALVALSAPLNPGSEVPQGRFLPLAVPRSSLLLRERPSTCRRRRCRGQGSVGRPGVRDVRCDGLVREDKPAGARPVPPRLGAPATPHVSPPPAPRAPRQRASAAYPLRDNRPRPNPCSLTLFVLLPFPSPSRQLLPPLVCSAACRFEGWAHKGRARQRSAPGWVCTALYAPWARLFSLRAPIIVPANSFRLFSCFTRRQTCIRPSPAPRPSPATLSP